MYKMEEQKIKKELDEEDTLESDIDQLELD